MNHYSRGIFQEQALLPIWSLSQFKWLNTPDKRKEALMDFLILPIAVLFVIPSFLYLLILSLKAF